MTTQTDTKQPRSGPPRWFAPALIGALIALAALVALALTSRAPVVQAPGAQSEAEAPAAAAPAAAPDDEIHGSLNPAGPVVEQIDLAAAKGHFDAGTAIFIDVRAGDAYGAGHIPGALTITSRELETALANVAEGTVLIAYGDASRPDSGQRGAQIFMEMGYPKVIALEGGFQAWAGAGYPVE